MNRTPSELRRAIKTAAEPDTVPSAAVIHLRNTRKEIDTRNDIPPKEKEELRQEWESALGTLKENVVALCRR